MRFTVSLLCLIFGLLLAPAAPAQLADILTAMRAGDDERALQLLDSAREQYPQDVDYMLARAQVLARRNRPTEALVDLREANQAAPQYEAPWRLRYALLLSHPQLASAHELADVRNASRQRFPAADWWQQDRPAPDRLWRTLTVASRIEQLSNDAPDWRALSVDLLWPESDRRSYRIGLSSSERFNQRDLALALGVDQTINSRWRISADLGGAVSAAFSADWQAAATVTRSLPGGWSLGAGLQHRRFETAIVTSQRLTAEKYVAAFRFAYMTNITRLHGSATSFGHALTGNWYLSDRSSLGLSFNRGEEAEAIAAGRVLETTVSGFTLSGRHRLAERYDLDWFAGSQQQGDFYRRRYVGLALSTRF